MRHTRDRYQHGPIRKVPRANGFAWEFRFYCTDENGERKLKTQTFDAIKYPTEAALRKAMEPQLGDLNYEPSIVQYMANGYKCPNCDAAFNPGCLNHCQFYFAEAADSHVSPIVKN